MKKIWYLVIVVLLVTLQACNKDKKKTVTPSPAKERYSEPAKEQPVNAQYAGQHNGCVVYYDELFCSKKYKDGVLNAGDEPVYIKDENGSMVILDKNHSRVGVDNKVYEKVDLDEK